MSLMYWLSGVLALFLFGYLLYALLARSNSNGRQHHSCCCWSRSSAFSCCVTKPLGSYIADVMEGRPNFAVRAGTRLEGLLYSSVQSTRARRCPGMQYAIALLLFNVLGAVVVYGLQRLQLFLPLNPQKFAAVSADSSFNTAVSFITNTNWQGYSGESTMGYLVQMAGLAVQNFLSAATGIAVAIALIRGFARHTREDHRQFLGRCHARDSLYAACRSPRCSRSLSRARASSRISTATRTRRPSRR